jgi:hypothetical protein
MKKSETPSPRLAAAALCALAALLLLLCSVHLYAGGLRWGAASVLLVGLGLAAAAAKSFKAF